MTHHNLQTMPEALVLCGGLGTRLRSVYDAGPKALAPIGGRPFLGYMLDWLHAQGVRRAVLCVGYRAEQIQQLYPAGQGDPQIAYSVEPEPLGTAGALKYAEARFQGDRFFVVNGDSLADISLAALLDFHCEKHAAMTLATVPASSSSRFGSVEIDAEGRVTGFREKAEAGPGVHQVNAGVYVMERSLLDEIPAARKVSLEREIFPVLAGRGLYGLETGGSFIDIGVPVDFASAQTEIPGRLKP
jgi:D-glycero-alpha-D-manno-heptose 1-phosphate guanylyltransferase